MDVEYFLRGEATLIYAEEDADFVPQVGDEVCIPPDGDPSNGWHAFDVLNRRYFLDAGKVVCYIER